MEPRIPGEKDTESQETEMPGYHQEEAYFTAEGRADDVEIRRRELLDGLSESRGRAYERSLDQANRMAARDPMSKEDSATDGYYYKINDWVKVKNMARSKFEFKWIGPFHIQRLGNHPRTYYLMDFKGKSMPHPVSEKNIAPWLADVRDNMDYAYYGRVEPETHQRLETYVQDSDQEFTAQEDQELSPSSEPTRENAVPEDSTALDQTVGSSTDFFDLERRPQKPFTQEPKIPKKRRKMKKTLETTETENFGLTLAYLSPDSAEVGSTDSEPDLLPDWYSARPIIKEERDIMNSEPRGEMLYRELALMDWPTQDPIQSDSSSLSSTESLIEQENELIWIKEEKPWTMNDSFNNE
jgi:hypothetical protein